MTDWSRYLIHGYWTGREFEKVEGEMRARSSAARRGRIKNNERIEDLERDVGAMAMLLRAMTDLLVERSVVKPEDLRAFVHRADMMDGVHDGKLDPRTARGEKPKPRPKPKPPRRRRRFR